MTLRTAAIIVLLQLGYLLVSQAASLPRWYSCTCPLGRSSDCVCPSLDPPAGLDPKDTPQFILFTHDDAVGTDETYRGLRTVYEHGLRSNPAGCPPVATLFALARNTNCTMLQQLYRDGFEVASHSLNHKKMNDYSRKQVEKEVVGGRIILASQCGIPKADIVGFRAPFLQSRPMLRKVLHDSGGFLYDSSLLERPEGSVSRGLDGRLWPYSMAGGIPQNCAAWSPAQECTQGESYPGLFQVPVWVAMEWAKDSRSSYEILKSTFDAAYYGNRAPLPIFIHTSFFGSHLEGMLRFIDYAHSMPNTYFVTMRQLLSWMMNPVPASQLSPDKLGCRQPGGPGPGTGTKGQADSQQIQPAAPESAQQLLEAAKQTRLAAPPMDARSGLVTPAMSAPAPAGATGVQQLPRRAAGEQGRHVSARPADNGGAAAHPGPGPGLAASWSAAPGSAELSPVSNSSASDSSSSSSNVAEIAGGVAGGVAVMLTIIAAACFIVRRRQRRASTMETKAQAVLHSAGGSGSATVYVSTGLGGAASGFPAAKTRTARLLANGDSGFISSPRFPLTPRTRMAAIA